MGADCESVSLFFKKRRGAGGGLTRDSHRDMHHDPLAPTAIGREPGALAGLSDPHIQSLNVHGLDGSKHQPHALARLVGDDSCAGCEGCCALGDEHIRGCSQSEWTVRVHVAALLAQIPDAGSDFCAGLGRCDLNDGGERVPRIRAPIGSGWRRGLRTRLFRSSGLHGRSSRTRYFLAKLGWARRVFDFNVDLGWTRKLRGLRLDYDLHLCLRVLRGFRFSLATLRSHKDWFACPIIKMLSDSDKRRIPKG